MADGPEAGKASPVRVVGVSGSLRPGSHTRQAVAAALRGAEALGAATELLDLAGLALPWCDGRDDESTYPRAVFAFRDRLRSAQGVVLGTPEYHGSFSGVLKNALDLTGFEEFEGKVVGLVAVSGGAFGGSHAMAGLRSVSRSLHAWVIPEEAAVPRAGAAFGPDGTPSDARIARRLDEVGRQVARFAFLRSSPQVQEFLRTWEAAKPNPGGPGR